MCLGFTISVTSRKWSVSFRVFPLLKAPEVEFDKPFGGILMRKKILCATLTGRYRITAGISQKNLYTLHNFTP